jgi:hypothetical protein
MTIFTVITTRDSGVGSLRDAVDRAQSGDTIQFSSRLANQIITLNRGITIAKDLIVDGFRAPNLAISGNKASRIFNVTQTHTSLTLRNLIFKDGFIAKDLGGAIHTTTDVKLTIHNSQFQNNVSRGGGAIFVRDRTALTITDSVFDGNDGATYGDLELSGGAIGTRPKSNITIKGSTFTNNKGINGGAIYSIFSNLSVEDSVFLNNDSSPGGPLGSPTSSGAGYTRGYGGAIYIDGASRPNDPRFYTQWQNGDKVGGTILIRNSRIEANKAAGEGGGLFLFGYPQDTVIVEGSTIANNQVILDNKGEAIGGGLRAGPTRLTIRDTTFANNSALTQGGGLWYDGESPVTLTNTTFSGNRSVGPSASGQGGAIYSRQWSNATTITNSTFNRNVAGDEAGAIFQFRQPITATNSIFNRNTVGTSSQQQTNVQLRDGGGNIQFPPLQSGGIRVTKTAKFADPKLGRLQQIGDSWVHPLLVGSAAIDTGIQLLAPRTDQRGITRDAQPDIGAYEFSSSLSLRSSLSVDQGRAIAGKAYSAFDRPRTDNLSAASAQTPATSMVSPSRWSAHSADSDCGLIKTSSVTDAALIQGARGKTTFSILHENPFAQRVPKKPFLTDLDAIPGWVEPGL